MALKKITELDFASEVKEDAGVIITQKETVDGKSAEAVMRVSIDALVEFLRKSDAIDTEGVSIGEVATVEDVKEYIGISNKIDEDRA